MLLILRRALNGSLLQKSVFVLIISTFLCVATPGQGKFEPLTPLVEARAVESGFARPRRVSTLVVHGTGNEVPDPFSFHEATAIERIAFQLTNEARLANGLVPLAWDAELCRLARLHSEDMSRRGFFDHETPEGLRPKDRARVAGVLGFRVIAENIAYNKGYENPAALAVDRWMNSSGHRANILYYRFQYSAIGSYVASDGSVYLTQIFISR